MVALRVQSRQINTLTLENAMVDSMMILSNPIIQSIYDLNFPLYQTPTYINTLLELSPTASQASLSIHHPYHITERGKAVEFLDVEKIR